MFIVASIGLLALAGALLKKFAQMLQSRLDRILSWTKVRVSNGAVENQQDQVHPAWLPPAENFSPGFLHSRVRIRVALWEPFSIVTKMHFCMSDFFLSYEGRETPKHAHVLLACCDVRGNTYKVRQSLIVKEGHEKFSDPWKLLDDVSAVPGGR